MAGLPVAIDDVCEVMIRAVSSAVEYPAEQIGRALAVGAEQGAGAAG